jgi:hypothetical protein
MSFVKEYKQYIGDTISFIVLIGAIIFAFNYAYLKPLEQYNELINSMSQKYKSDEMKLYSKLKELEKEQEKPSDEIKLDTIPSLLKRINDTCRVPDVIIRKLDPVGNNPFAFTLEFISSYFDFINVLSEFEKLNIIIHTIDIKPFQITKNSSKHIISLVIEAIDGGEKLSQKKVSFMNQEIQKHKKRDPFQRFAKMGMDVERLIDLSWEYKLSGIGKIGGRYVATIDRKLYFEGDRINQMKITNISKKSVYLEKTTQNGLTNFVINFRTKVKDVKNDK